MHTRLSRRRIRFLLAGFILFLAWPAAQFAQTPSVLPGNHQTDAFTSGQKGTLPEGLWLSMVQQESVDKNPDLRFTKDNPWPSEMKLIEKLAAQLQAQHPSPAKLAEINVYRGYVYFMEGDSFSAAEANRKALAAGPNPSASYNLVLDDIKLNAMDDAHRDLQQGIRNGGTPAVDFSRLSTILDNVAAATDLFNKAIAAFNRGDYAEAAKGFMNGAELWPDNGHFFSAAADALLRLKAFDPATKMYRVAAQRDSQWDASAYVGLGYAACAQKKWDEAETALAKAKAIDSTSLDVYTSRASCLLLKGDWQGSKTYWEEAMKIAPDNPHILNDYGYELSGHGERLQDALAMVQRAVKAEPANANYLDSLGYVQFKLGQTAQALESFTKAIQSNSTNPNILDHYGDVLKASNAPDKAEAAWNSALNLTRDDDQRARIVVKLATLPEAPPAQ